MRTWLYLLTVFLSASLARASSLRVTQSSGELNVGTITLTLPRPEWDKALQSGLATTILLQATLHDERQIIAKSSSVVSVVYDLWTENFTVDKKTKYAQTTLHLRNLADVFKVLNGLSVPSVEKIGRLKEKHKYRVECLVLIDPVEGERLNKIRAWLAKERIGSQTGGSSAGRTPLFNSLYRKLIDETFSEVESKWKEKINSGYFYINEVPHETGH